MLESFERIIFHLVNKIDPTIPDTKEHSIDMLVRGMNNAFLISLCGGLHPLEAQARTFLKNPDHRSDQKNPASFYLEGLSRIRNEIEQRAENDQAFAEKLEALAYWIDDPGDNIGPWDVAEHTWDVFFPEGKDILGQTDESIQRLRKTRLVSLASLNPNPISDPGREILFTSNVLLTVPSRLDWQTSLRLSADIGERVEKVLHEPQTFWYDHPVRIGVAPENNEILYGLKGLNRTMAFEKSRGNLDPGYRPVCVLSVSVTHKGLHGIAGDYIKEEIARVGGFEHLRVFAFTENDTKRLAEEVLAPAAARYLGDPHPAAAFPQVFGVDGEYGRHYSFLKAIAPFWQVLIDPAVRATFKIDLDQVFPQDALLSETGASAFEHFKTPLWGATGNDFLGRPVEIGLLAGALVNERDIHKGLFTPDVPFPEKDPSTEDLVFYSHLPQAMSTEAEMMADYRSNGLDGLTKCLQRIHVTGGTTGALIDTLRRFRPFTPSFVGRAEDQAFIMPSLVKGDRLPAYLHEPGLIMRHDKESFAAEAVLASRISKVIGDYIRTLIFSYYARTLENPPAALKQTLDPFTGCFISHIPQTIVFLRLALKAESLFKNGNQEDGLHLVQEGAERIRKTLYFVDSENSQLANQFIKEKKGWEAYYNVLSALEKALTRSDGAALKMRGKARNIIRGCALT
jgi:hypothetical protein